MLSKLETYNVQKPAKKSFRRNRVIVSGIDAQWDGDLASMENVMKYNDGTKFLLVLIDIFSRYLTVKTFLNKKKKKRETVAAALKAIFKGSNTRKPKSIRFDQGGEFKSSVSTFLKKIGIHVFTLIIHK